MTALEAPYVALMVLFVLLTVAAWAWDVWQARRGGQR